MASPEALAQRARKPRGQAARVAVVQLYGAGAMVRPRPGALAWREPHLHSETRRAIQDRRKRNAAGALRHTAASFEHLSRAREETRKERERGWLREPRRWKVAEFKIGDQVLRTVVPTKACCSRQR